MTFRDNATADVTVVGKGYNSHPGHEGAREPVVDDTLAAVIGGRQQNARERRRQQKGKEINPQLLSFIFFFFLYAEELFVLSLCIYFAFSFLSPIYMQIPIST